MTFTVESGATILATLEANGIMPSSSCQEGTCGTCETAVLEGIPDHRDSVLDDEDRESGETMMICVSRSKSPRLVLDLTGAAETLRRLAELFDCVWVGLWSHTAHPALREALDLPAAPWPWIPVQFGKLAAIRAYAAGRPWVWIDDSIEDLGPVPDPADGLLVRVDEHRGLADVDPDALADGIRALLS